MTMKNEAVTLSREPEVFGFWCAPKGHPNLGVFHRLTYLTESEYPDSFRQVTDITELVDRAHVTRLKAEVDKRGKALNTYLPMLNTALAERAALHAELTRARELVNGLRADTKSGFSRAVQALHNWANQSAPAAKGPDGPLSELEVLREAVKELEALRDARVDAKLGRGHHVAYAENGVLNWMTGRKFQNCELYTHPAEQPAPVAFPGYPPVPEDRKLPMEVAVAPPPFCRQKQIAEGRPYPRSSCQACGKFSPKSRECDALIEAARLNPIKP